MKDIKKLIEKNLYLRVDFNNKYKKTEEGIVEDTKFFLIGVLPVAIFYKDGTKEKASINYALKVERDPYLRILHGSKATDENRIGAYKKKIKEIVSGMEGAFLKLTGEGKFNNKEFNKILIINLSFQNAGRKTNQNRGSEAVCEERQETSGQTDQADSR